MISEFCSSFQSCKYFHIYFLIPFSPTSASKMATKRMEISVFVKFINNFCRLVIGLKIAWFNYDLEGANINAIEKTVLR